MSVEIYIFTLLPKGIFSKKILKFLTLIKKNKDFAVTVLIKYDLSKYNF